MKSLLLVCVLALAATSLATTACGSDNGESADERAVRQTVLDAYSAYDPIEIDPWLDLVTENYLEWAYGVPATKDDIRRAAAEGRESPGVPEAQVEKLTNIEVSGDTATADVWERQANSLEKTTVHLIKQGDQWLLDSVDQLTAETPDGATEVQVEAVDDLFTLSDETIPAGDVAFQVTNAGTKPHNFLVVNLPEGVSIEEAFRVDDPREVGAEYVGLFGAAEHGGGQATWILEDLEPGRYGYFCWVQDAGTPHAYKGMNGEFTVE